MYTVATSIISLFAFAFPGVVFQNAYLFLLHSRHCVNSCSLDAAACFSLLCPIHCVNGEAEGTMQQRKSVALQRLWKRQQNCFYMTRTGSPNKKNGKLHICPQTTSSNKLQAPQIIWLFGGLGHIYIYIYIHTSGHEKMGDGCGSVESSEKYEND
jgi:hypothetical protein